MKVSVLTENNPGPLTAAEHGLSYLIEADGKRILFDAGQSDLFRKNADIMGDNLKEIDMVILSCGHAGIVNTMKYASAITGIDEIYGIMGGFHLKEYDLQANETIKYLKTRNVTHILPSHCISGAALEMFRATFSERTVKTGSIFSF